MAEIVQMIALSPTMEEGTILKWKKKEGDPVKVDEPLCDVETDKASMEYLSSQEGVLLKILKPAGSSAKVAEVIGIIGELGEDFSALLADQIQESAHASIETAVPKKEEQSISAPQSVGTANPGERIKASPLAKRIASEKGIDLTQVPGSGPQGRVIKQDVESFVPRAFQPSSSPSESVGAFMPRGLNDQRVPVTKKRSIIAKRLGESLFTAPHFYLTLSIEMDSLLSAREKINGKLKEKLSLNAFIIKFLAEALKRHQALNSTWEGDYIQNHSSVDIGIAVAQSDGLITPIVKGAHGKGITQIDQELKGLIDRARSGTLKPEEFTGATFTISNLGSFGIEEFTAIINPPGAAIMALGATMKVPVVTDENKIEIRQQMKVTLSCDHRVIDGAVGAAFLTDFKKMVEDPISTLL